MDPVHTSMRIDHHIINHLKRHGKNITSQYHEDMATLMHLLDEGRALLKMSNNYPDIQAIDALREAMTKKIRAHELLSRPMFLLDYLSKGLGPEIRDGIHALSPLEAYALTELVRRSLCTV